MSLREAAEQALRALIETQEYGAFTQGIPDAVDALRAALAEAPKAEPVAWQARQFSEEDNDWSSWGHVDAMYVEIRQRYPNPHIELRPLYTHPPAALPESAELSDEEILSLWRRTLAMLPDRLDSNELRLKVARAVLAYAANAAARGKG